MSQQQGAFAQLKEAAARSRGPRALTIPVEKLKRDPDQPRTEFEGEQDDSLTESVSGSGLAQPLVVRPDPQESGTYFIIAGERRFRSAQKAGLNEVPCYVRDDVSLADVPILQLVENLHRRDLNPLDVARGLKESLRRNPDLKQAELARRLGKHPSFISHHLSLLDSPVTVEALEERALDGVETARRFSGLAEPVQKDLLAKARTTKQPITRRIVETANHVSDWEAKDSGDRDPSADDSALASRSVVSKTSGSGTPSRSAKGAPGATAAKSPSAPAPARRPGRPARPTRYTLPALTWDLVEQLFKRLNHPVPATPSEIQTELFAALGHTSEDA